MKENNLQEKMIDESTQLKEIKNSGSIEKRNFILDEAIMAAGDYGVYHIINLLFLC